MDNINLETASTADIEQAAHWASFDSPTSRLFKTHEHSAAVSHTHDTYYWVAKQGQVSVGFVSLRIDHEHIGHLDLVVPHSERRQGIGDSLIKKALLLPEVKSTIKVQVVVKLENFAARKVLRSNGFREARATDEGMVFERRT